MGHLTLETENVVANAVLSDVTTVCTIISRKDSSSELDLWSRDAYGSNPIMPWLDLENLCSFRICFLRSNLERFQKFTNSSLTFF